MVKGGIAAALAVLVSAAVAPPAVAAAPLRFAKPLTLGRWLNNGYVLRAVDLSGDGIPDLVSADPDGGVTEDISVWLGRGDGSFSARRAYRTADGVSDVKRQASPTVGDFSDAAALSRRFAAARSFVAATTSTERTCTPRWA